MYWIAVQLLAAIVLLLWAVRMVRTAVERAYAPQLKRMLILAGKSAWRSAGVGAVMAVALQSSTAVAALVSGFASGGLMTGTTGLTLMLGAYLGSALVASILSFDLSLLTAPLIIIGGTVFLRGHTRQTKQAGRMILGIAFVLLSLEMVSEATAPWRDSDTLGAVILYLRGDLITSFLFAAVVTWASYSSVASVLVIITFGASGLIPFEVAAAFILGANLGGTLIAFGMTRNSDVRARRIAAGALALRGGAAVIAVALLYIGRPYLPHLPGSDGLQASGLHILFNLIVLFIGMVLAGPVHRITQKLIDDSPADGDLNLAEMRSSAFVAAPTGNIDAALASATRELLRMSEMVEVMLQPVMEILQTGDKNAIRRVKLLEPAVDRANREIKLFITRLDWDHMDTDQARRASALAAFATGLEQAGDIVSRQLLRLADQKLEDNLGFSQQGWEELSDLHMRVLANLQLANNVLISEDVESARDLIIEKDEIGMQERRSMERHFQRLRSGNPSSFETSELHLETAHALRRINSLLSGIAYSVLGEDDALIAAQQARGV
ncbi:MAG: Na/Pi cotransporter family protein [Phyllobacteriaceae bacterium]|nr:Na/Pi cotransporter family protein [Phyllobacteriaceae bacterium]